MKFATLRSLTLLLPLLISAATAEEIVRLQVRSREGNHMTLVWDISDWDSSKNVISVDWPKLQLKMSESDLYNENGHLTYPYQAFPINSARLLNLGQGWEVRLYKFASPFDSPLVFSSASDVWTYEASGNGWWSLEIIKRTIAEGDLGILDPPREQRQSLGNWI